MGAACSSSAITKYKVLRTYLKSKPCITFDFVQTFLPVRHGPPIILFGENHFQSEADSMIQRCVTVFTALKVMVSDCPNPTCRIHFIMESHLDLTRAPNIDKKVFNENDFVAKLPKLPEPEPLDVNAMDARSTNKFNLADATIKYKKHANMYTDGLSVIHFDLFHFLRGSFNVYLKNPESRDPRMNYEFVVNQTKQWIFEAFVHMDVYILLCDMFDEAQTRTEEKTEPHRQRVEAELNLLNEVKPGHHFWMFQITRWVYEFTHQIIMYTKNRDKMFSSDQSRQKVWQKDLVMAADKITDAIDDITHRPNNWSMFELITLCGDYITYCVYLRKRLHHPDMEMPSDDIFVLYGGSMHMMNISELIAATVTHKEDLVKLSTSLCNNPMLPMLPLFFRNLCSKHAY